jgi:fatty acid amide hydrolase
LALALCVLHVDAGSSDLAEDESPEPMRSIVDADVSQLRIGAIEHDGYFAASPSIRRAVRMAADAVATAGAKCVPFEPPDVEHAISVYFGLIGADGGRAIREVLDGGRADFRIARLARIGGVGPTARWWLAMAATLAGQPRVAQMLRSTGKKSSEQLQQLSEKMNSYRERFARAMELAGVDALLMPPHGLSAPPHGSTLNLPPAGSYCYLPNLLGYPAGTVPVTRVRDGEETDRRTGIDLVERAARFVERGSSGLPLGVQVVAKPWREDVTLAIMRAIETQLSRNADYPRTPVRGF